MVGETPMELVRRLRLERAAWRLAHTERPVTEVAFDASLRQRGSAMIAIYHDNPESVPLDQLRSDAAIVVPPNLPVPDGLVEQRIPAGRFACALHVGPYEQLGDAWARFMGEWLPASGHRVGNGPTYEIYLNDPTTSPKPELRTEMYVPLA